MTDSTGRLDLAIYLMVVFIAVIVGITCGISYVNGLRLDDANIIACAQAHRPVPHICKDYAP